MSQKSSFIDSHDWDETPSDFGIQHETFWINDKDRKKKFCYDDQLWKPQHITLLYTGKK